MTVLGGWSTAPCWLAGMVGGLVWRWGNMPPLFTVVVLSRYKGRCRSMATDHP
jgi:hypothetical protein